jgi:hypothetical protein
MSRTKLCLWVGLTVLVGGADALPCGGGVGDVAMDITPSHPDLPLTRIAEGNVGVLLRTWGWRRGTLVAAYRAFTGAPLDAQERAGYLGYAVASHRLLEPSLIDPAAPPRPAQDEGSYEPDVSAYAEARSDAGAGAWPGVPTNGWSQNGLWVNNCLVDAFRSAAAALRVRTERYGAGTGPLFLWIDAQDAVFSNCGETPGRMPTELAPDAPVEQRRDRAYQIAAAHFYAGRYDEAERRFRAIAADSASPWREVARYLVVRAITRAAQRGRTTPDLVSLNRASREARELRDDAAAGSARAMARRYEGWIDALRGGTDRAHALGVALARPGLGMDFGESLRDYTALLATVRDVFARQPGDPDRLTTWIAVVEGSLPRDVALGLFRQTRDTAWAVAALVGDGDPNDRALDPALARAAEVPREHPAWATAHYHRLRILAARGALDFAEVTRVRARLTAADGPSARHLFRDLALAAAPDLEHFLAEAHGAPAAWVLEDGSARPIALNDSAPTDDLTPAAAAMLAGQVPLSVLARAAASSTLPLPLRARVAEATLMRAALLGDDAIVQAIGAIVPRLPDDVARRLTPVVHAPAGNARRYAALLALGIDGATPTLGSSYQGDAIASDPWLIHCNAPLPAVTPARFLTAPERAAWTRERARAASFGGLEALLARESARLAPLLPREPRMPSLLAAAVRGTRNHGCPDVRAPVRLGSRAAFQALHRLYPRSPEATATRYWY